ncbi:MAG: cohesin domain-containing protein [Bacteroidetes bacterium]|nr:cohesin domain-containing protein [Bacteroidota bacterium]
MKKLQLLFIFLLLSFIGSAAFSAKANPVPATPDQTATIVAGMSATDLDGDAPLVTPTLTGPATVCLNVTGNVYTTEAAQTSYAWVVTGGTITAGGNSTSNTATVTWTAVGSKSISVTYSGATTTLLPVTVNPLTSISVAASATNVAPATLVTFTATAVNPGPNISFQWKVNGAGVGTNSNTYAYAPANGDAVYCLLTSDGPCFNNTFTSNVVTITVTIPPVLVTVSTRTAFPGQSLLFPVKLKGAGASGTPISAADIQIAYDPAVLHYDTIVNFYAGTPSAQWFFSGNFNVVAANWQEPSLLTVAVPDSTTLFEIKFTYLGGTTTLPFTVYDFTNAQYNLIPANHLDGGISPAPASLTGPVSACQGNGGNVYTTDASQTNYSWSLTGGTITSGGTASDYTATVTWNTAGTQGISVSFTGSSVTTLPVTVDAALPVAVTIAASANPVCAGSAVAFTATPVNGGLTPVYQWKKNGANVGTNNPVYNYTPANALPAFTETITCTLTSSLGCKTGSPALSNSIFLQVNPYTASISVAASANPVMAGTSVTYTATVVNGGPAPVYQWKINGAPAGTNSPTLIYTPANTDVIFCLLSSSAPCVTGVYTSNAVSMTVNYPVGSLLVTLPNKTAMPGDVLYYPVKLKGASASGTPVSAASIQITYDPAVFHYDTLVNFYAGTPATQWFYSGNLNTVAANWQEPGLNTLAIPDSTKLFEIKFTYLGGTGTLPFTVNEFTNALYDLIPTNHVNGGVTQLVPTNNAVQNVNVAASHDTCFSAIQTISVAGNGTIFAVADGGSATFVAGQMISFLPGTSVVPGGYLHGYITLNGQYCNQPLNPVASALVSEDKTTAAVPEFVNNQSVRVYPNPTTGTFTVEVMGDNQAMMTRAEINNMNGVKVRIERFDNLKKHEFSMPELKPGIYFIHVFTNERSEILKIVKL